MTMPHNIKLIPVTTQLPSELVAKIDDELRIRRESSPLPSKLSRGDIIREMLTRGLTDATRNRKGGAK